jgi:hypothetical protein
VAAQDMIARFAEWQGRERAFVATDATYGNGQFLQWLMERGITQYMRTRTVLSAKTVRFTVPTVSPFSFRKQQLSLSRRPATYLRRSQCSEPYLYPLYVHRDPQTLWCVLAKSATHPRTVEGSRHPHA